MLLSLFFAIPIYFIHESYPGLALYSAIAAILLFLTFLYGMCLNIFRKRLLRVFEQTIDIAASEESHRKSLESELLHPIYWKGTTLVTESWLINEVILPYSGVYSLKDLTAVYLYVQLHPYRNDRYEFAEIVLCFGKESYGLYLTIATRNRFGNLVSKVMTQYDKPRSANMIQEADVIQS